MPFSLQNKKVLITGAAGGIGAETARVCAELGASLVLADIVEPVALAEELRRAGATVVTYAFDVADRVATERVVADIGELDAVVANAGFCPWDDWEDESWDEVFGRVIDINLLGVIHLVRACLPRMCERGAGNIVLVSSVAGRMGGLKASPHYVAAKGGIMAMTKWLARKAAPHGVVVNSVAPGATATGMTASQALDCSRIPLQRLAEPREIALPISFLCSDAASYICGTTLDVNGGVHMS
ncbi:SDR family oxidoreductase [Marinobacter sp. M3C]|jgi:NAD(P)-dependent dehydrogenase (short-subunit alcohol dehydrogenase family)|uniref:SDR family NAD(P)-dependent oxidoreductase n=1 Tax=unclassified Marinobacter TaxID=83889 RepID=UPI00200E811C|nr:MULTISPECIES: SDR family NAD(P)-dependent oxidoreductase [unclassified Marinobacter]MCL1476229.1 SDR family oxidoreductase [Marinobacter sp.]MCL1482984.1 SDR family oxidoreductase [Marinobacter sp.]MCL1488798.1 SDR family oxidoreductase [Marinobacter sp.]UQG58119.1 SDR family oxidoreductase [Marinobacter sp. M4C]UQG60583.1 SDR family oxidoreductase [Marinobacter sp. M3C]